MNAAHPTYLTTGRPSQQDPSLAAVAPGSPFRCRHRDASRAVAALAEILAAPLPDGLPARPQALAGRLREDDQLARRVWSHPTFAALVEWATRYHPDRRNEWEEMAVHALARGPAFQAGRLTAADVRTGMLNSARWISHRGRHGERLDHTDQVVLLDDFDTVQPPTLGCHLDHGTDGPSHGMDPPTYLSESMRRDLPTVTATVMNETWRIARDHYGWLIDVSGLTGKVLLAEAQARSNVNRSRRLVNRLPLDWPPATRKAASLLFTGSPSSGDGLLVWWATTPPDNVPVEVRIQWNGLLAVVDPEVGTLPEAARRRRRDRAREWSTAVQTSPRGIAL